MATALETIEWIGEDCAAKLAQLNIHTTDDLLARMATPADLDQIARDVNVDAATATAWVERADLMRLDKVNFLLAHLMQEIGLRMGDVARSDPHDLLVTMRRANVDLLITRVLPPESVFEAWVEQAKTLT